MRLYTYRERPDGDDRIGVGFGSDSLYALEDFGLTFADMNDLICNITPEQMDKLRKAPEGAKPIALDSLVRRAPIPYPMQDVVCLGINYDAHHEEAGRFNQEAFGDRPKAIYFSKRVSEANCDGGKIPRYEGLVNSLDYEVELGVILGKDAFQGPGLSMLRTTFSVIPSSMMCRRVTCRPVTSSGTSANRSMALRPWAVHRDRRRDRISAGTGHSLLGQRRDAPERFDRRLHHDDRTGACRADPRHDAQGWYDHCDRYPGRRRHGHAAALLLKVGRCCDLRDRRHWYADQRGRRSLSQ